MPQPKTSAQDASPAPGSIRLKTPSASQMAPTKLHNSFSFAKTKPRSPSSQLCHGLVPYLTTPPHPSPPKHALPSLRIKTNLQALKQGFSTLGTIDIWCQVILCLGGCPAYWNMFSIIIPGLHPQMPVAPLPPVVTTKKMSRHYQCLRGHKIISQLHLRNTWEAYETHPMPAPHPTHVLILVQIPQVNRNVCRFRSP